MNSSDTPFGKNNATEFGVQPSSWSICHGPMEGVHVFWDLRTIEMLSVQPRLSLKPTWFSHVNLLCILGNWWRIMPPDGLDMMPFKLIRPSFSQESGSIHWFTTSPGYLILFLNCIFTGDSISPSSFAKIVVFYFLEWVSDTSGVI